MYLEADLRKLRVVRKRLGWTQRRLGVLMKVTSSTISRWERARQKPSQACRDRLSLFLGTECRAQKKVRHTTARPLDEPCSRTAVQPSGPGLELMPISLRQACQYIAEKHRHHKPPVGAKFALGVGRSGQLTGVATVGRPVSRHLDDRATLEVTRVATDGTRNACSMLLGAAVRAARAIGYRRVYSYTLAVEPGSSLRAAGFRLDKPHAGGGSWSRANRARTDTHPVEAKQRWVWP